MQSTPPATSPHAAPDVARHVTALLPSPTRAAGRVSARTKKAPGQWGRAGGGGAPNPTFARFRPPVPGSSHATPLDRHQLAAARGNERQQDRQGQGWRRAARGDMHGRRHRLRRRAARRGVGSAVPAVVAAAAGDGGTGERAAPRAGGAGDRPRRARALAGRAPRVGQARVLQPPPAAGRAAVDDYPFHFHYCPAVLDRETCVLSVLTPAVCVSVCVTGKVPSAAEPGGVGDEGGQEHPGDGQGDGGEVGGVGGQGHRGGAREDHREGQEEGLAVGAAP